MKSPNGSVASDETTPAANGHAQSDAHGRSAHTTSDAQSGTAVRPEDSLLLTYADILDDIERPRIATANRRRALVEVKGMPEDSPEVRQLDAMAEALERAERLAATGLERAMALHPLGPWVTSTRGLGLKSMGRLLAAIGNPCWNAAEDRPRRGPSELWAYCGLHTVPGQEPRDAHGAPAGDHSGYVAARRQRGVKSNWNAAAKKRAYVVASAIEYHRASPYRPVYDRAKEKALAAVHPQPCPQCGPPGRPAAAGSPLRPGHARARALRAVAKAVLRDVFREGLRVGMDRPNMDVTEPKDGTSAITSTTPRDRSPARRPSDAYSPARAEATPRAVAAGQNSNDAQDVLAP